MEFESPLGHVDKWNTTAPHEGDSIKYWRGRNGNYHNTAGENNRTSKLNEDAVRDIRARPEVARVLAEEYGVHIETIKRIRQRKDWKHI